MKYPKLEEPCRSCIYKCFRVENQKFISDKNCRWQEKENKLKQEEIWKTK
jgi:hypothetical protein